MSKKQSNSSLPEDFFDSDKKSKKEQEDELAKELEQFEKEMAALQAESEEHIEEEFEKLQNENNLDELDQQISQWKRIIDLEKRAEELKNKPISENPMKKFKNATDHDCDDKVNRIDDIDNYNDKKITEDEKDEDLNDIEAFQDKLFDWRSKGL